MSGLMHPGGMITKVRYAVFMIVGEAVAPDAVVYRFTPSGKVELASCLHGGSAFGAFTFSGRGDSITVRYNKALKVLKAFSFRHGLGTISFGPTTGQTFTAGTSRSYGGPGGSGFSAGAMSLSIFEEI